MMKKDCFFPIFRQDYFCFLFSQPEHIIFKIKQIDFFFNNNYNNDEIIMMMIKNRYAFQYIKIGVALQHKC